MLNTARFVERSYTMGTKEVRCRFFRPVSDGQDCSCRFEIDWPDGTRTREIWGGDEVQALLLAMLAAHDDLLLRRERDGLSLRWLGGRGLGLPPRGDDVMDDGWTAPTRD